MLNGETIDVTFVVYGTTSNLFGEGVSIHFNNMNVETFEKTFLNTSTPVTGEPGDYGTGGILTSLNSGGRRSRSRSRSRRASRSRRNRRNRRATSRR